MTCRAPRALLSPSGRLPKRARRLKRQTRLGSIAPKHGRRVVIGPLTPLGWNLMAEVIVLHAPNDRALARSVTAGLGSNFRALMLPAVGPVERCQIGSRMIKLVIWSAEASAERVAASLAKFAQQDAAPLALILCDDTPAPEALTRAARATLMVSAEAESLARLPALVQTLYDAEWGAPALGHAKPSAVKRSVLAVVIAGGLALGVAAGVRAWAPNFAAVQGGE